MRTLAEQRLAILRVGVPSWTVADGRTQSVKPCIATGRYLAVQTGIAATAERTPSTSVLGDLG